MVAVRRAATDERDRCLELTVSAFAADALLRWLWPDEDRYAVAGAAFFGALLDLRLAGGAVWVDDELRGTSMWNPPGGLVLSPGEDERTWAGVHAGLATDEGERMRSLGETGLEPSDPHWYLGVLAVDPSAQGRGIGGALVRVGLAEADGAGVPAFLETATPSNLPLYEHLGFAVTAEAELPDGPTLWGMTRPPAPARPAT